MKISPIILISVFILFISGCEKKLQQPAEADLVVYNAKIYTADANQQMAQALAVSGDRIIAVGTDKLIKSYIGVNTEAVDAQQQMLLPGLHDIHMHPMGLVSSFACDLNSESVSLVQLRDFAKKCIENQNLATDEWLFIDQWNFTKGNDPSDGLTNLRAALDAVSPTNPIYLRGNDGHHGAANSVALASANTKDGVTVGLNSKTLQSHFAHLSHYIGVDKNGRPNGSLNESARFILAADGVGLNGDAGTASPTQLMREISRVLAQSGITTVQDAAADIHNIKIYEDFAATGEQTFRLTAALISDFNEFIQPLGMKNNPDENWIQLNHQSRLDLGALTQAFINIRDRQKNPEILKADSAKIFVDGVIEGNPLATPPTLPNAATLHNYHQPKFQHDPNGDLTLTGYIDSDSLACTAVEKSPLASRQSIVEFIEINGFHPGQCLKSNGTLEHPKQFISQYIARLEKDGFAVHAHAIGDRAVKTAIEAFAKSKKLSKHSLPQTIAHAQQMANEDIAQAGEDGIFIAFTFAWAIPDYQYDITVVPFIDRIADLSHMYNPQNYAISNHYPANSARKKGAVITAGSDAPVDSRDPRPFVNIAGAVTRAAEGTIYNSNERLSLFNALDAYTINGARALRQEALTGSIEVGKKADFIVIDTDLIQAAKNFDSEKISTTKVVRTYFDGRLIYSSPLTTTAK